MVLKIHYGNRSVTIIDSLGRPHSRLAKAITTWMTEFWDLAPETHWQAYALPAGPTPPVAHSAAHAIFNAAQLFQDIPDAWCSLTIGEDLHRALPWWRAEAGSCSGYALLLELGRA